MMYKLFYCLLIYVFFDNYCIAESDNQIYSRIKRFEEFNERSSEEIPDNWHKANKSEECKNWFQSVMDFFFGEPDEARGNSGGIFTRMFNWIRKGMCRMNGTCDDEYPVPSPDIPPGRVFPNFPDDLPPRNPDAEEIPDQPKGNKESNDVQ